LEPYLFVLDTGEDGMDEHITLELTLRRADITALLEILNRRVERLQQIENNDGCETIPNAKQEKDAIIAVLMALESAVKMRRDARTPSMTPIVETLARGSWQLPSLEAAEDEARQTLAQATETLARAHAAFVASLAGHGESGSSAASEAITAEEQELRRAQAAHEKAAERLSDAKRKDAEIARKIAYARSERAHDEAVAALRQYEPLALEMLKLFSVLSAHADLALADVEAADMARINPHTASAVRHLESALAEHKQSHVEGMAKHIAEALHELELASG
jgi:hypothetical protein